MRRPSDTSADAQDRHLRALADLSPEQRVEAAAALSDEVRALAEAGIRQRHPEFSPAEVRAALADVLLGRKVADAVRRAGRTATR